MRNAVVAACTFLTITALCDNAMARGASGVRARPSTVARSHAVAITAHSRRSGYSHLGKVVGWRYFKDHGWRRDQHTRTAQSASAFLRMNPEGISGPERSEAKTGATAAFWDSAASLVRTLRRAVPKRFRQLSTEPQQ
jgi:hypothetical protein